MIKFLIFNKPQRSLKKYRQITLCKYYSQGRKNYYEVLNIHPNASLVEIKTAYYRLAKKYHPDIDKKSEEYFKTINLAYETLKNNESRKKYDLENLGTTYVKKETKVEEQPSSQKFDFNPIFVC